jgi:hypothetical protein
MTTRKNEVGGNASPVNAVWYLYIALLPLLGVGRIVERVVMEKGGFASRYLPLFFLSMLAVGVYAAVKKQALFSRRLWVAVFRLSLLVSVLALIFALTQSLGSAAQLGLLLLAALLVPAQLQLRAYCAIFEEL